MLFGVWIISHNKEDYQQSFSTASSPTITQNSPPISPIIQQGFSIGIGASSPGFSLHNNNNSERNEQQYNEQQRNESNNENVKSNVFNKIIKRFQK